MARPHSLGDLPVLRGLPGLPGLPSVSAAQMAEIDRAAIEEFGIGLEMLMENASRQIAAAARICLEGSVAGKRIVALAGHGSNGGDALGAARHLLNWGAVVTSLVAGSPERLRPVPRRQFDILAAMASSPRPVAVEGGDTLVEADALDEELAHADLVLDGLLGYSVSGAPWGEIAALIRLANRSRARILAIDLPSGMHPDTGEPLGLAIRAAVTVTLALPKTGLLKTPSRNLVGELLLADIAIPPLAYARFGIDASAVFVEGDLVRVER